MSYINNKKIEFIDNSQVDSLDRLRTTSAETLFDSPLKYNKEEILWDEKLGNTGTVTYNDTENLVDLEVATTGDTATRQSREYFSFQSGKSHLAMFAVNFISSETNMVKEAGVFDDNNGLIMRYDDTNGISIVIRTNISGTVNESVIPQSNWQVDKLNGTGPSGITIDLTKMQLICVDFAWTGIGRLRVGFLIDGKIHYVHILEGTNTNATNTFGTPSLPLRYKIESINGSGKLKQQASAILVEGNFSERGFETSVDTGLTSASVTGTTPLLSVRLKSEYTRAEIIPSSFSLLQDSNNDVLYYQIIFRPDSLNGTQWFSNSTKNISEYNTDASDISGGIVIKSGFIPARMGTPLVLDLKTILPVVADIDGNRDIISIVASNATGTGIPVYASMSFKEIY